MCVISLKCHVKRCFLMKNIKCDKLIFLEFHQDYESGNHMKVGFLVATLHLAVLVRPSIGPKYF